MKKPRIIKKVMSDKEGIFYISLKDVVKRMGNNGYVLLPNQLIGKYVKIKIKVLS